MGTECQSSKFKERITQIARLYPSSGLLIRVGNSTYWEFEEMQSGIQSLDMAHTPAYSVTATIYPARTMCGRKG